MTRGGNEAARHGPSDGAEKLARCLGWFSIGLGLAEVLATRILTRMLSMQGREMLLRAYGVREIATGIGIISANDPTPWVWGRVGGDVLDLATLATGREGGRRQLPGGNRGLALAAVAGVTALDVICAQRLSVANRHARARIPDYSDRTGMPRPADAMRGIARDFRPPRDMQIPEALRPWTAGFNFQA
jgi:hypothetical protein